MYYSLVQFLNIEKRKFDSKYILNENKTLYRIVYITKYDINSYYILQKNIICFPTFTSTSLNDNFNPSQKSQKINNIDPNREKKLKMVLHYRHRDDYAIQRMILNDFAK